MAAIRYIGLTFGVLRSERTSEQLSHTHGNRRW